MSLVVAGTMALTPAPTPTAYYRYLGMPPRARNTSVYIDFMGWGVWAHSPAFHMNSLNPEIFNPLNNSKMLRLDRTRI